MIRFMLLGVEYKADEAPSEAEIMRALRRGGIDARRVQVDSDRESEPVQDEA